MRTSVVITLSDLATTGSAPQVLGMSENAGAPASALPVPAGSFLQLDDVDVSAGGNSANFQLQQTNDGVNWFPIGALDLSGFGAGVNLQVNPDTAWQIRGDDGPAVAFRLSITTPNGALPVASVITGYRVS